MTRWVMFGHSPLLGDIVDIIRANGGRLSKVVQNIPEEVRPGAKSLGQLIDEQSRSDEGVRPIEVQALADFTPQPRENYLIGFRSDRLIPLRQQLREKWRIEFPPLCHPRATVSPTAIIGEGSFVGAGAIVGSGCLIGRYTLLNRGCTIGHDCVLEDFVNVGPAANLASFVTLRRSVVVGIGASVINWIHAGPHSVIAGGAVVTQNVPEQTLVAGVPAQNKKRVDVQPTPGSLDDPVSSG